MKNKLKRVTIATLSACMIANAVPIPGNVAKAAVMNITVRQSRQSGVARATCPD